MNENCVSSRQPLVTEALGNLNAANESLAKKWGKLCDKLIPVRNQKPQDSKKPPTEPNSGVGVVDAIKEQTKKIYDVLDSLDSVMSELEI